MSHVDEGTLHALVDNALDADERLGVEAHLASCGDCARRFAEATAMARQVNTLLGALDDVGGTARIIKSEARAVRPSLTEAVPGVTPIRRRFLSLKRAAIAASVLLVAGVSFQLSDRRNAAPDTAALVPPVVARPKTPPMVATPSVVDAPADSYVATPPPPLRQRVRSGPRNESEVAVADRVDDVSKKVAVETPISQRAQEAVMKPVPVVAADVSVDSGEQRRRDARSSSDALGRVQAQEQARAQQNSPAPERSSRMRDAQAQLGAVVVTGVAAAPQAASGNAAAAVAKPTTPKAVPLAGYTTAEEESVPGVTRRRYVSASGTALLLLITQPVVEAKAQAGGARASEFVVTSDSGRSIVRWHSRGFDYELQALLAPDSLMKLATQIK